MKYLSVCSGIEAASVAFEPLGWKPLAFSEIEPFPSAVLAHHFPDVPNLGDMTRFDEWENLHDVDLLVGGTPCQAFSVAGLRNSLSDDRGNLTLTYVQILNKIDHERTTRSLQPSIALWENVPGILSTSDNAFGCFLGALAGENVPLEPPRGKWSNAGYVRGPKRAIAWRVLDAQYFGVAQRRRRVFVVASARDGFCPAEVLFEFDGVRRDIAPSRKTGQKTPANVGGSFAECSEHPFFLDRASFNQGENAQYEPNINQDGVSDPLVARCPHAISAARMVAFGEYVEDGTASTMKQRDYKDATDLIATKSEAFRVTFNNANGTRKDRPNGGCYVTKAEASGTLTQAQNEILITEPYQVRRLTTVEAARLQGFPDFWTKIPWRGKPAEDCPDGPQYKAYGNSMAVPCMAWLGKRIQKVLNHE